MDDDDIVVIEEIRSPPFARRSAPLREIEILDEPGPSTSNHFCNENLNRHTNEALTNYAKLQQLEQLIAKAKANSGDRRSPKITVPEVIDVADDYVVEDISIIGENLDEGSTRKKRKKEPSEAALQKKKEQAEAKLQRKKEREEAQLQKQLEKKRKALEREKSAAVNSRCEQYMYCHVSRLLFESFEEVELQTRMEFLERNIQEQLICDEERADMQVLWYRKGFDVEEEDGRVEKREYKFLSFTHSFTLYSGTSSFTYQNVDLYSEASSFTYYNVTI
ncbi:hypothetical protein OESDEN_12248 [Oesophagostomum dentatum]|uniref:Uncharacterized protein n=1 Tax=Oesophagostomum dentatum TaxID=61180 RepID=A0A0B1SXN3_OESDE|nr:hypothetical protein OESDEN_12248 [Oesophagostomum dentatum]